MRKFINSCSKILFWEKGENIGFEYFRDGDGDVYVCLNQDKVKKYENFKKRRADKSFENYIFNYKQLLTKKNIYKCGMGEIQLGKIVYTNKIRSCEVFEFPKCTQIHIFEEEVLPSDEEPNKSKVYNYTIFFHPSAVDDFRNLNDWQEFLFKNLNNWWREKYGDQ